MSSELMNEPSDHGRAAKARLQQAKQALYRETILDAAERVFAERGYEAAKVQAVAKEAGVSLAKLYATFPKKSDIFRAVQADRLGALMRRVGADVVAAQSPLERLRRGIEGYLRFHIEHPNFLKMQLQERVPWGTADEQRTPEQTRAWTAGLEMMKASFRDGMKTGVFVEDDPEVCARTVTAMSQVRLATWIARGGVESPDEVAQAALAQMMRTFSVR